MEPRSDNFIFDFFSNMYVQVCFIFRYWLNVLLRPFITESSNDARPQRTSQIIINGLMKNFANEDIKLINPNEPVEETFMKKITEKDYDSAMKLAKKFDFDTDLIYTSMWENNDVTVNLIDECLTKVSKTIWILKECVNSIPPQLDVLKYLIEFGIGISEKENLADFLKSNEIKESHDENLSGKGKRCVQYRQTLIHYLHRLKLYEEILQRKHGTEHGHHFDRNYYSQFRTKSIFELAINFANQADIDSLVVLLKLESHILSKHFLVILANLPETATPVKYIDLIDTLFSNLDSDPSTVQNQLRRTDWSDEFATISLNQPETAFESKFYEKNPHYQAYLIDYHLDKEMLTSWLKKRALEILDFTNLVDNSLQLLEYGIEHDLEVKELYTQMDLYSLLIYEGSQSLIAFEDFEKLSLIEKMNLILCKHEAIYAVENVFDNFIQKLSKFNDGAYPVKVDQKDFLREFLRNLVEKDFEKCLKIFENCSMVNKTLEQIESLKMINDACDLIELAIDCIHAYDDPDDLDLAFRIMECLPDRSQGNILMGNNAAKLRHFNRVNDQADQIEYFLSMIEVLREYGTKLTVKDIESIVKEKSASAAELFFRKVISNFCSCQLADANISLEWKNFLWNLQDLRKNCFSVISPEDLLEIGVTTFLFSGKKVYIQLALNHVSFNFRPSNKKLSYEKGRSILEKAASDYIKFANPIQDNNLELARLCLQVFKEHADADEAILEELDFIDGLILMCSHFGFDMLPIKVKQFAQPRVDLMETLLKSCPHAYAQVEKLLHLSKLLRVCKDDNDQSREGVVLAMVGKVAIHLNDLKAAHEVCQMVLDRNLCAAWELCYLFAKLPHLDEETNLNQQLAFLSFALTYCPESDIDAHFSILYEIKSIKATLHKSMPQGNAFLS